MITWYIFWPSFLVCISLKTFWQCSKASGVYFGNDDGGRNIKISEVRNHFFLLQKLHILSNQADTSFFWISLVTGVHPYLFACNANCASWDVDDVRSRRLQNFIWDRNRALYMLFSTNFLSLVWEAGSVHAGHLLLLKINVYINKQMTLSFVSLLFVTSISVDQWPPLCTAAIFQTIQVSQKFVSDIGDWYWGDVMGSKLWAERDDRCFYQSKCWSRSHWSCREDHAIRVQIWKKSKWPGMFYNWMWHLVWK